MTALVLFDIDGTLFYGKGCGRAANKLAMLEVFGTHGTVDTHHFGGRTDWASLNLMLAPHGFTSDQIAAAMPAFDEAMGRHLAAIIHQFPVEACAGGHELVNALTDREDVLLGIITGNVSSAASIKLHSVGYDVGRFPIGVYGSEAPERYLLPPIALQRAHAHRPGSFERIVIIGDTPEDVTCARSINARCVAVASGFGDRAELEAENPAVLLDSLADTMSALEAIFG